MESITKNSFSVPLKYIENSGAFAKLPNEVVRRIARKVLIETHGGSQLRLSCHRMRIIDDDILNSLSIDKEEDIKLIQTMIGVQNTKVETQSRDVSFLPVQTIAWSVLQGINTSNEISKNNGVKKVVLLAIKNNNAQLLQYTVLWTLKNSIVGKDFNYTIIRCIAMRYHFLEHLSKIIAMHLQLYPTKEIFTAYMFQAVLMNDDDVVRTLIDCAKNNPTLNQVIDDEALNLFSRVASDMELTNIKQLFKESYNLD